MTFRKRSENATPFEIALAEKIEALGCCATPNGTEHTHTEFVKSLNLSTDPTSLAIRFQPDGVAHTATDVPISFYWEAKSGKRGSIEKAAYEQYMLLCHGGRTVLVFFEPFHWRWNRVEHIQFIDSIEYVSQFPEQRQFPVVGGWIRPRKWSGYKDIKYKSRAWSGTDYKYVNSSSLRPFTEFIGILQSLTSNTAGLETPSSAPACSAIRL